MKISNHLYACVSKIFETFNFDGIAFAFVRNSDKNVFGYFWRNHWSPWHTRRRLSNVKRLHFPSGGPLSQSTRLSLTPRQQSRRKGRHPNAASCLELNHTAGSTAVVRWAYERRSSLRTGRPASKDATSTCLVSVGRWRAEERKNWRREDGVRQGKARA